MKFQIRPFVLAFTLLVSLLFLILLIWNAISGFGKEIMTLVHSIYPNPFIEVSFGSQLSTGRKIAAIFLDLFYIIADSLLFSLALSFLYKFFYKEDENKEEEKKED